MKKLLQGDNTDLKTDRRVISAAFLWVLLFNPAIAQVPINGFCQVKSFPAFPGYNRISIFDVNYDSFKDVILYSSSQKSIAVIEGEMDNSFTDYKIINSPYNFTNIIPVYNKATGSEQYVFSSRKKRTVGMFSFSSFGRFNLLAKIGFDSYPENISVADINNNGNFEYLISGSGFKGLSLLSFIDGELNETKLEENSIYGEAVFVDISNDGHPDITAFNLFNNTFEIFYNDGKGNFERVRTEFENTSIENLETVDFNKDGYDDLIYTVKNSFKLAIGDSRSFYDSSIVITTEFIPHRFTVADFNGDDLNDIAYIDSSQGILSVIIAKGKGQFHTEIIYMKKEGLTDLHFFRSHNSNSLVLLNKVGKIFIVSRLLSLPDETNLIPAVQPSTITKFDLGNDGITDFCYIDIQTKTINFLVSDLKGIPEYFYSVSVSADHISIVVDDEEPFNKGFYCYSPDGKLLEIINYDFPQNRSEIDQLYSPGIIKDIELHRTDELVHIFTAYEKNNALHVREYEYHNFRYTFMDYPEIEKNVVDVKLVISDHPRVHFYKIDGDSIRFTAAKLQSKSIEYKQIGVLSIDYYPLITGFSQYLLSKESRLISLLLNPDASFLSVVSDVSVFNIMAQIFKQNIFDAGKGIEFYFNTNNRLEFWNMILYSPEDHSFNRIEIKNQGKELSVIKLFDSDKPTDFIVQNIISDKKYLIYTQQSEG
ncbi:MAG: FG-GAP repeat domain-containing protein, partial [Ignavibacteriaceae bacterium]